MLRSVLSAIGVSSKEVMAKACARFVVAWLFLSALVNLRFPGDETKLSYLWPSSDVTLLFALFALAQLRGWRLPRWHLPLLVFGVCLIRVLRFGDGIQQNYFHRPFNAYLDLPQLPELVRLLWATSSHAVFVLGAVASVLLVVALVYAIRWALREAHSFMSDAKRRSLFFGVVLALVVLSPFGPKAHGDEQFSGMFASSIVPRVVDEADFLLHVSGYREVKLREVRAIANRLQSAPNSLARLESLPVFVFLVESYGVTVFDPELTSPPMQAALDDFDAALKASGYSVATGLLDSPVYGGSSWLAQATLATAVQTRDEAQLALVKAEEPPTIADFFKRAGYRTVLVQPGTTRPWPERDYLRFEARYAAFDLGYRGPKFSWAPMPDQYVLDVIHRKEVETATRPLFITYALVSSHAPWSEQPRVVEDWNHLSDGDIFNRMPKVHFDTRLVGSNAVREAYLSSIRYDLSVLARYLGERLKNDALVFVLGDHQPIPKATAHSKRRSVPVHVISRRRQLLEPWYARGYRPSLRPNLAEPVAPLASFLPTLLEAMSPPRVGVPG
ncbi:MAG: sulfatase-like hydrolase/transferase [Myxococcota bacterium]